MLYIIGIIIIVVLIINNSNLKKQIKVYQKNKFSINYCPSCGTNLKKTLSNEDINAQYVEHKTSEVSKQIKTDFIQPSQDNFIKKDKLTNIEMKNNIILITGSILIILATVVFLTSSWSSISNLFKVSIIFIMFIVFVVFSKLAKERFNLPNTAKAFKYISLIYLPLSLISILLLGLLGNNIFTNIAFRNLYLGCILIISSVIYYISSKKDADKYVSILSIITAILGIIFIVKVFTESLFIILLCLFLFSVFLALLYERNIYFYNELLSNYINNILYFGLLSIIGLTNVVVFFTNNYITGNAFENIILLASVLIYSIYKNKDVINDNDILNSITIFLIFNSINDLFAFETLAFQVNFLLSIILIYGISYVFLNKKSLNISNFVISTLTICYIILRILETNDSFVIPIYGILFIYLGITIVNYLFNDKLKRILLWYIPIIIELCLISLAIDTVFNLNIIILFSVIFLALSLLNKFKKFENPIIIPTTFFNIIYFIVSYSMKSYVSLSLYLIQAVIYYLLSKKKNLNYKYLVYIFIDLFLLYLSNIIGNNSEIYALALGQTFIIMLEVIDKSLKDSKNFIFIICSYILSIIIIASDARLLTMITVLILSLIFFIYLNLNKKNTWYLLVPLLTPLVHFFLKDFGFDNDSSLILIISILIIMSIPILSIYDKDYDKLSLVSYIYLIFELSIVDNVYIPIIMANIISLYYVVFFSKKKLYQVLLMISFLMLYYQCLSDFNIEYNSLYLGLIVIYVIYSTRYLFKENISNIKVIEYIVLILINFLAISMYINEVDGMIFVSMLTILTIYSYQKKFGPIFLVTITFIVINLFLLTRMFWLSIPWWIYILVIGILLISFAVNNEIKEQNNLKAKLEDLKNKLDL